MKKTKFFMALLNIILFVASIFFIINDFIDFGIVLTIISSVMFIFFVKSVVGSYTNMSVFFVGFSALYGLSGPINVIWGDGLHSIFSLPYHVSPFIFSYSIASIGLIIGILIYNITKNTSESTKLIKVNEARYKLIKKRSIIYLISTVLALSASLFEIINLYRIGGIGLLFKGKAIYQSLTAGLSLTLPSTELIIVSFALIGLYLSISDANFVGKSILRTKILLFSVYSLPYLLIKLILGQRGVLLSLFLCIFAGTTYFKPIKRIKPKLFVLLLTFYLAMSFIYANRAIVPIIPENPKLFVEMAFTKERFIKALNPGSSEFGAAFGNFSEFYNKYNTKFMPQLGFSYIKGLVVPIPSFIYPGQKPTQVTYEFRDEFFISEASRGTIAGTGFSSILEAYMNFHYLGVFMIYTIVGYFLQKVDFEYRYKSIFTMALYLASISLTISYHRSDFGTIFASVFLRGLVILFILQATKVTIKHKTVGID